MRTTKYTKQFRAELLDKFEKYIESAIRPNVLQFAVDNDILQAVIYDFAEFSHSIKRCKQKHELFWWNRVENSKQADIGAMFALKAVFNYRDSTPIQIKPGDNKYLIINITGKSKDELEDLMTKRLRQIKAGRVSKVRK